MTILFAFAVVLVAGTVSGLAAFGFALVAVPPLLLIFDPPTVTAIVFALAMITRWVIFKHSWQEIRWDVLARMIPTALIGCGIGLLAVERVDALYIELTASLVVLVSSMLMLKGVLLPGAESPAALPTVGLISGALGTATGMAGPPMAMLFVSRKFTPQEFRGTMSAMFYVLGIVTLVLLSAGHLLNQSDMLAATLLIPAALAGTVLGQRLLRRFSARQFQRIVLTLLMITGVIGVTAAIRHLIT